VCELNNSTSAISQNIQQKNLVPLRMDSWPRLRASHRVWPYNKSDYEHKPEDSETQNGRLLARIDESER